MHGAEPKNSLIHRDFPQCLDRPGAQCPQIYRSVFSVNFHLSETKCCFPPEDVINVFLPLAISNLFSLNKINPSYYHFKEQKPEFQRHTRPQCKGNTRGVNRSVSWPTLTNAYPSCIEDLLSIKHCEIPAEIPQHKADTGPRPWLSKVLCTWSIHTDESARLQLFSTK